MRIAYLDCSCGISGDMTVAALIDAGIDLAALREAVDSLGLPGVAFAAQSVMRCGFRATHLRVRHPEQHAHRRFQEICGILDGAAALTPRQRELALRVFTAIGQAEARVHGTTLDEIHFHEVGAIDSIVDVVAAAVGFDLLGAQEVIASPVPTGRGRVSIAHGVCTIPTPGTAELLRGLPLADLPVEAELTTPTGAAILRCVASRFGPLPPMILERIGYGAGTRDFPEHANVLRLFVGEAAAEAAADRVWLLETNLDDVSAEIIGYTQQKLLAAGALDAFSTAIQMKKNRPGTLLSVLCRPEDRERLEAILFAETATFGVRRRLVERTIRTRQSCEVETPFGAIQCKRGEVHGAAVFTPEYESCAQVAARFNVPLRAVYAAAEEAARRGPVVERPQEPVSAFEPGATTTPDFERAREWQRPHDHDHSSASDHDHTD